MRIDFQRQALNHQFTQIKFITIHRLRRIQIDGNFVKVSVRIGLRKYFVNVTGDDSREGLQRYHAKLHNLGRELSANFYNAAALRHQQVGS